MEKVNAKSYLSNLPTAAGATVKYLLKPAKFTFERDGVETELGEADFRMLIWVYTRKSFRPSLAEGKGYRR